MTPQRLRPTVALGLAVLTVVGLAGSRLVSGQVYRWGTRNLTSPDALVLPAYGEFVAQQTDVDALSRQGRRLLEKNLPGYAALLFRRASELDPNYRDAAYAWAYAVLQANPNQLSLGDRQDIHQAINQIEKVDPHYLPMLKLKLLLARLEGDAATVAATQARLKLLGA